MQRMASQCWIRGLSVTFFIMAVLSYVPVDGKPGFVRKMPNGNARFGGKVLGHSSNRPDKGDVDAFGDDYDSVKGKWADLCSLDSDEDGKTNGEELGDPECVWREGDTPSFSEGLSNPGDSSDTNDGDGSGGGGVEEIFDFIDFSNPIHIGGVAVGGIIILFVLKSCFCSGKKESLVTVSSDV